MNWIEAISQHHRNNTAFVLVTPISTAGSTPRGTDAKIVVSKTCCADSIGGGQLEFQAIQTAREMLKENRQQTKTISYNLNQDLQQCCGGKGDTAL